MSGAPGVQAPRLGLPSPVEAVVMLAGLWLYHRYFWLLDDGFVYFRYVDNWLLLDAGLVFNRGEFVEGFTSPLWLLPLGALRIAGLDHLTSVYVVGLASLLAFQLVLVRLNGLLSPPGVPRVNGPLVYLGTSYGVLCYFSSGVETPWVQLAAACTALYVVRPETRWLELVVAQLALLRPDLAVPLGALIVWRWRSTGALPWRLVAFSALPALAWLSFRVYYYADLFPNTFYLKNETWPSQGFVYLHDTLGPYGVYVIAPIAVGLFVWLRRTGTPGVALHASERLVMCVVALSSVVYVVKVGGDARHFRYLAFPFCLAACSMAGLAEHVLARMHEPRRWIVAPSVALLLALGSAALFPRQLPAHPLLDPQRGEISRRIADAAWHRHWPLLRSYEGWRDEVSADRLRAWDEDWAYAGVSSRGPCAQFYRDLDQHVVQLAGLTNAFVARTRGLSLRPGHKLYPPLWFQQLRGVYEAGPIGRGMFEAARQRPDAPPWLELNRDALDVIEAKVFNRHDLLENVVLATKFPQELIPMAREQPPGGGDEVDHSR